MAQKRKGAARRVPASEFWRFGIAASSDERDASAKRDFLDAASLFGVTSAPTLARFIKRWAPEYPISTSTCGRFLAHPTTCSPSTRENVLKGYKRAVKASVGDNPDASEKAALGAYRGWYEHNYGEGTRAVSGSGPLTEISAQGAIRRALPLIGTNAKYALLCCLAGLLRSFPAEGSRDEAATLAREIEAALSRDAASATRYIPGETLEPEDPYTF